MKDKRKKEIYSVLLVLLIIGISLGYAALSATFHINGSSQVKNNTWDIHFDNVVVNSNSVELSTGDIAATINPSNTTEVTYNVTLKKPGDFYEFTVDAVNAGTIDGMVSGITSKLNGTVIDQDHPLPVYLDYSVTYSDDVDIENNQLIKSGESETYKVRLEFNKDVDEANLPAEDITPSFSFEVGFVQATSEAIPVNSLYRMMSRTNQESNLVRKYTQNHHDSYIKEPTQDIYYWYASNSTNATSVLNKNNVIFGGFCWQILRTTDTGGVKIIYNGIPEDGKCSFTTVASRTIGKSKYNDGTSSPAYLGYMYNPNTLVLTSSCSSSSVDDLYSTSVTYDNGLYTLVNPSTSAPNNMSYYKCSNSSGQCAEIEYTYYSNLSTMYCISLNDGRTVEEAFEDMMFADNVNQVDSTIKSYVDSWYENNLIDYSSSLEDTIFCNDRRVRAINGWESGHSNTSDLTFISYSYDYSKLDCENETDKFSLYNNKAKLKYPIGLATAPEIRLWGDSHVSVCGSYWLISPSSLEFFRSRPAYVSSSGVVGNFAADSEQYVRPVVSLKSGIKYSGGDGSKNSPYIIE